MTGGDSNDVPTDNSVTDGSRAVDSKLLMNRRDYMIGIALLFVVVFLWTSSNFITQDLFEGGYEKPFLVTYLNTSAFTLYLLPWLVKSAVTARANRTQTPVRHGYEVLATADSLEAPTSTIIANFRAPSIFSEDLRKADELEPLTTRDTAKLASIFCLFWFIANWSVNASLGLTSVASATILSSTSGFFTLLVGRVFHVETLTLAKISAVVTSFFGVVLVSFSDSSSAQDGNESASITFANIQWTSAVFGDALALLSAIFYALYVILLKVRIKEESRIDMQLFFGFVGLFNVLMLWPIGVILHLAGLETISAPPSRKAWAAVFVNMFITLSSDYIYVLAMLKTTPLVVTIGLSLTIPLAIIGDFFLKIPTATQAILGALLVVGAFVVVGVENSRTGNVTHAAPNDEDIEVDEVESVSGADDHA